MLKFRIKILHHLSVAAKEDLNPITEYPSNQKSPLVNPSKFDVKNNTKFPDNPSVTGKDDESDTQQPPRHPQFGQQRTNKRSGGSRLYLRGKRLKMISPQSKPWQAASDYEGPRTETHLVTEPIEGTLIICFQGYGIENSHQIILFAHKHWLALYCCRNFMCTECMFIQHEPFSFLNSVMTTAGGCLDLLSIFCYLVLKD